MSGFDDPKQAKYMIVGNRMGGGASVKDAYAPTLTPPVVNLIRFLQGSVVRSVDDDKSAPEANLSRLQKRVLLAIARFECEMGGVL